jgi:hypothetical protein
MSAYDPKRTFGPDLKSRSAVVSGHGLMCYPFGRTHRRRPRGDLDSERFRPDPRTCWPAHGRLSLTPTGPALRRRWSLTGGAYPRGGSCDVQHEAPRVHHAARRRGGGVAARGARATAGDPRNRISQHQIGRYGCTIPSLVPSGVERSRLRRRSKPLRSSIAMRKVTSIDCLPWRPIWFVVRSPSLSRPAALRRHWRPRQRPPRSRLSSPQVTTRSKRALFTASIAQKAISPE